MRTAAIDAVLRNYPALLEALETISNESHDDYGRRANGILAQLERFDTYFGLKLVFSATEQTSIALQGKNTTVQEALLMAVSHIWLDRGMIKHTIPSIPLWLTRPKSILMIQYCHVTREFLNA